MIATRCNVRVGDRVWLHVTLDHGDDGTTTLRTVSGPHHKTDGAALAVVPTHAVQLLHSAPLGRAS